VHTPAEVFGRDRLDQGLNDEDWLPVIGASGWVVFGRDWHILDRDLELQAYRAARVHRFLLPGQATRGQLIDLLALNLGEICAAAAARHPNVYWVTPNGLVTYERRRSDRDRRRRRP
jgi:hypothetical protein